MRNTVTNLHKKAVRPDISRLLQENPELAEYINELESDNDFLISVVEQQRARIMELTYLGGYIEVSHDVNYKYYREPRELKTRAIADKYRKIYKMYHKQLLDAGWPRIELGKKDITRARRNALEQAISEKIYSHGKSGKAGPGKKKKDKPAKDILREIMPSPYKVNPDLVLGDEDHHFKILLAKKERNQKRKPAS